MLHQRAAANNKEQYRLRAVYFPGGNNLPAIQDMKKLIVIILLSVICLKITARQAGNITGTWRTPDGQAEITISAGGGLYQGKLTRARVSIKNTVSLGLPAGLLGIYILRDLAYTRNNRWEGTIYDPKSKKSYSCYAELQDANTLKVRGYKGISLFGKSQLWERVD